MYTFHLEAAAAGDDTAAALAALQAAGDAGLPAVHELVASIQVRCDAGLGRGQVQWQHDAGLLF